MHLGSVYMSTTSTPIPIQIQITFNPVPKITFERITWFEIQQIISKSNTSLPTYQEICATKSPTFSGRAQIATTFAGLRPTSFESALKPCATTRSATIELSSNKNGISAPATSAVRIHKTNSGKIFAATMPNYPVAKTPWHATQSSIPTVRRGAHPPTMRRPTGSLQREARRNHRPGESLWLGSWHRSGLVSGPSGTDEDPAECQRHELIRALAEQEEGDELGDVVWDDGGMMGFRFHSRQCLSSTGTV